jgi:hypothetical protein
MLKTSERMEIIMKNIDLTDHNLSAGMAVP